MGCLGNIVLYSGSGLMLVFNYTDFQSREAFWRGDGPKITMDILRSSDDPNLLDCGFSVVVAAATGNEIVKEAFVELKIEELFLDILRGQPKGAVPNLYDAIRVLLTPDDNRVAASQVNK